MLKKNGQVELFKVVARGMGLIPVLKVRKKANSGGLTKVGQSKPRWPLMAARSPTIRTCILETWIQSFKII